MRRALLALAVLGVAVGLFVALRPGTGDEEENAAPATTNEAAPTTEETPTATVPAQPAAVAITIRGGEVEGGLQRIEVGRGDRVQLIVRADVADEVHVHGYDIVRDVAPNTPARFSFRAKVPGRFEIELETRRLQIAELEVGA